MTCAGLVWANLRRRPTRTLLALAAVTTAFMLHGLAFGIAAGIRRSATAHAVAIPPALQFVAICVSGAGLLLVLLLTINATAHSIRGRTQELALLKALGFAHHRVLALLVAEGAVPSLAGAILGLVCAKGLFAVRVATLPALQVVPAPVYSVTMIGMALVLALLVALLSAVIPAAPLARADVAVLMRGVVPTAAGKAGGKNIEPSSDSQDSIATRTRDRKIVGDVAATTLLRQIMVATRIGLSTLPTRLKGALLIVGSVGAVVFLLLLVLSTGEGIRIGMLQSGDPAVAVLRSNASVLLDQGQVPDDIAARVVDAPGIARSADGTPLVDAEVFTWSSIVKRGDGKHGYAVLVGVGPSWPQVTRKFELLSGRLPRVGNRELLVGVLAGEFSSTVQYAGEAWRVVGTFTTHDWWDGYFVANAADVKAAGGLAEGSRAPPGSAARVRLDSAAAFNAFRSAVAPHLPRSVVVERETDYYKGFWHRVPKHLAYMVFVLATLLGAGASLGTALVLHDSLDQRRREIATLRLLGFDSRAVAASVLMEAFCLSVLGSLLGTALAWLWLDGTLINGAWSVVRVTVDLQLLGVAVIWGGGIALAGSLPLMLSTLRQTALDAIRDLLMAWVRIGMRSAT